VVTRMEDDLRHAPGPARPQAAPEHRRPAPVLDTLPPPTDAGRRPPGGDRPAATRPLHLTRRGVVVTVATAVVVVAALAVVAGALSGSGGGPAGPPAAVAVVARADAAAVAFDSRGAWLADDHDGTVRRFLTARGAPAADVVHVGGRPMALAAGFGRLWVADGAGSVVREIDPATAAEVGAPIPVAQDPDAIAAGDGGVWVASLVAGTVSLIDPHRGQVVASTSLPDGAVRLALGPGAVWVSGQTHSLSLVSPTPVGGSLRWRSVGVGQGPLGVAVGGGSVWVANVQSGTVSRVDPATVRVTATYRLAGEGGTGAEPEAIAFWRGRLWVGDGQQAEMVALDPATGTQVGSALTLPGVVRQLSADPAGGFWATTANPGTVLRLS